MNTVWILGDQLSLEHAALELTTPEQARVLMIESKARGSVLRYHQVKLVLVYSGMRHFARDLGEHGWSVDYYPLEQGFTFETALREHLRKHSPAKITLTEANSHFETEAVAKLGRKLRVPIELVPTTQFLLPRLTAALGRQSGTVGDGESLSPDAKTLWLVDAAERSARRWRVELRPGESRHVCGLETRR